jgi:hypothetical protein
MAQRTYDRIKNYSTTIAVDKTVGEIEKILSVHGAKKVMKEYGPDGLICMLAFTINTPNGEMPVKLPARIERMEGVFKVLVSKGKLSKSYWGNHEQAARTAWRTIKDWVDAQMALVEVEMVKVEEIFLPYVYSQEMGQTLFEAIESHKVDVSKMLNSASKDDGPDCIDIEPNTGR